MKLTWKRARRGNGLRILLSLCASGTAACVGPVQPGLLDPGHVAALAPGAHEASAAAGVVGETTAGGLVGAGMAGRVEVDVGGNASAGAEVFDGIALPELTGSNNARELVLGVRLLARVNLAPTLALGGSVAAGVVGQNAMPGPMFLAEQTTSWAPYASDDDAVELFVFGGPQVAVAALPGSAAAPAPAYGLHVGAGVRWRVAPAVALHAGALELSYGAGGDLVSAVVPTIADAYAGVCYAF